MKSVLFIKISRCENRFSYLLVLHPSHKNSRELIQFIKRSNRYIVLKKYGKVPIIFKSDDSMAPFRMDTNPHISGGYLVELNAQGKVVNEGIIY